MTETEKKLWQALRGAQISGVSFRRQHHIGAYIVDFCAPSHKLVNELDGGQHALAGEKDKKRDAFLEAQGFCVLRFWNNDVLQNLEGVLLEIAHAVEKQRATPP